MTDPDDEEVLLKFYTSVRPWGFWGPIRTKAMTADPHFTIESTATRDLFNVFIGVIWQMTFVLAPVLLVIKSFLWMAVSVVVMIITSIFLKKNWYERLGDD